MADIAYDSLSERGCSAIKYLKVKFPGQCDVSFYDNPLGNGRVCELRIRSQGIHRSETGTCDAEAAQKVSITVAIETGWEESEDVCDSSSEV